MGNYEMFIQKMKKELNWRRRRSQCIDTNGMQEMKKKRKRRRRIETEGEIVHLQSLRLVIQKKLEVVVRI